MSKYEYPTNGNHDPHTQSHPTQTFGMNPAQIEMQQSTRKQYVCLKGKYKWIGHENETGSSFYTVPKKNLVIIQRMSKIILMEEIVLVKYE